MNNFKFTDGLIYAEVDTETAGIGNFIKVSEARGAVGCSLFEFDLAVFLSSAWFKEIHELRLEELKIEAQKAAVKYKDIQEL